MTKTLWIRIPDSLDEIAANAGVSIGHVLHAAAAALDEAKTDVQVEMIGNAVDALRADGRAITHGLALPTPATLVAAAQRVSVCNVLLEGGHLKPEEVAQYKTCEREALEQLREALRGLGLEGFPRLTTRALTEDEVRVALAQGRGVREELEARVARMRRVDEEDARRKAR